MKPLSRLLQIMAGQKLSAALLSDIVDVRYLSGYRGSDAMLLVREGKMYLFTDARYRVEAAAISHHCKIVITKKSMSEEITQKLKSRRRLGVQAENLTLAFAEKLSPTKLVPLGRDFATWRAQKTPLEIAKIKRAIALTEAAFIALKRRLRCGMTELEIKAELEYLAIKRGADAMAFPSIIATGANAALPHAQPTSRKWRAAEPLLIDFGVVVDGCVSDLTRMLFVDNVPPFWRGRYQATLEAQLAAIATLRAGISGKVPDKAARKILRAYKLEKYFTHGLGHGLGRKVHEAPRLSPKTTDILPENSVVTVEPGIYFPQRGGIRIEDDVLIKKSGAEVLSTLPKTLDDLLI